MQPTNIVITLRHQCHSLLNTGQKCRQNLQYPMLFTLKNLSGEGDHKAIYTKANTQTTTQFRNAMKPTIE